MLQTWRPSTLLKRDPNTGVFLWILWNILEQQFYRISLVVASDIPTTIQKSQLGCLFIDSAPPCGFDIDQKLKQFFRSLNWLITCFQFQNIFWKNISPFLFWWKTYTNCCTNNYIICVQRLSLLPILQLSKCFQFQDVIWKMEEYCVSKNIKLKIWQ